MGLFQKSPNQANRLYLALVRRGFVREPAGTDGHALQGATYGDTPVSRT